MKTIDIQTRKSFLKEANRQYTPLSQEDRQDLALELQEGDVMLLDDLEDE